ncbi:helix-turn-helix transcriptional regulator [uncultured Shewanella sp.]|uniref:helix-turn-helix transcriptional regulator n=1 Tax=uncultured Shewanella sp. TaxID=173975 RepID=UPI00345BE058
MTGNFFNNKANSKQTLDINKLKALRENQAWTQEELAHLCNVSTRTIQRVEKTGHTSKETLKAISSASE